MQITEKMRTFWNQHVEHGDVVTIAAKTGIARQTIYSMLSGKTKETSHAHIVAVTKFFKERKASIKEINAIVEDQN